MDTKLIAIDLDGTLLNSDGIVSEATKVHLQKLKEKGYIITIATGRILNRALVGTDGAEFTNYIVSDAGAAVFKNNEINKEWKEVYALALSNEIVENIASYYDKDKFMTINICDRNKIHHYDQTVNITEFLENINEIIHVSVSFINNEFVEEYLKIFTKKFPMLKVEIMQDSFGEVKWLEIAQKGVEKYKGIAEVAKLEGILNENIIELYGRVNFIKNYKKDLEEAMNEQEDILKKISKLKATLYEKNNSFKLSDGRTIQDAIIDNTYLRRLKSSYDNMLKYKNSKKRITEVNNSYFDCYEVNYDSDEIRKKSKTLEKQIQRTDFEISKLNSIEFEISL